MSNVSAFYMWSTTLIYSFLRNFCWANQNGYNSLHLHSSWRNLHSMIYDRRFSHLDWVEMPFQFWITRNLFYLWLLWAIWPRKPFSRLLVLINLPCSMVCRDLMWYRRNATLKRQNNHVLMPNDWWRSSNMSIFCCFMGAILDYH